AFISPVTGASIYRRLRRPPQRGGPAGNSGPVVRGRHARYRFGMGKRLIPPEPSDVQEIALREALEERYLAYALSTIMNRALPDARGRPQPVHRRILYGMRLLRLDPGATFKKSAKIVGDVMGNFHPHGDQAIYDALVRLA